MPLDPDDPDLERIIEIANAELGRLEVTTARRLREMYERERDALLHRISEMESDDTFGVRHAQVITKALTAAIRRLGEDLAAAQHKAIGQAIELGADAGAREVGQLEARFGSPAASRAIASLAGVIPHRAIAATEKLKVFKAVTELANGETRTTLIELDRMTRAAIARGLIQGQSSRQMVPELRKMIGKQVDSKAWELERTLRTGTNAAVNIGHNQAYLEAKELLPDLKRRGDEHLGLAAKTGGRRENHPFSKLLHGAVAELDKPWVIPSKKLPVMFWPYDEARGAYVGKRYPAHLWERGREVAYRDAWEARRSKGVAVPPVDPKADAVPSAQPPGEAEGNIPQAGLTWKDKSRAWTPETLKNIQDLGDSHAPMPEGIASPTAFFRKRIREQGARQTGYYRYAAGSLPRIELSVTRPDDWIGQPFALGKMSMISATGDKAPQALGLTLAHERYHHILIESPTFWDRVGDLYDEALERAKFVSLQAQQSPRDWFSETALAFRLQPAAVEAFDSEGYNAIGELLRDLGVPD